MGQGAKRAVASGRNRKTTTAPKRGWGCVPFAARSWTRSIITAFAAGVEQIPAKARRMDEHLQPAFERVGRAAERLLPVVEEVHGREETEVLGGAVPEQVSGERGAAREHEAALAGKELLGDPRCCSGVSALRTEISGLLPDAQEVLPEAAPAPEVWTQLVELGPNLLRRGEEPDVGVLGLAQHLAEHAHPLGLGRGGLAGARVELSAS